jgi:hypothetical protein
MRRGDTPVWELTVIDEDGAAFNLSGYTIRMTAKTSIDQADADAVFQLSTVDGTITITNAAGGLAEMQPERDSTNTLTVDTSCVWDVQIAKDGTPDETFTVADGTLLIRRDVTRTAP